MRKIIASVLLLACVLIVNAQSGILDRGRQSAKNKINQKVDQKIDKAIDNTVNKADSTNNGQKKTPDNKVEQQGGTTGNTAAIPENKPAAAGTIIKADSKFDFVPGEKIVVSEDFSQDAVGDFPEKWNTSSSGEIVTINGQKGKWLALKKPGIFYPELIKSLPENFTLECDVAASSNYSRNSASFEIDIVKAVNDQEMKELERGSGQYFRYNSTSNGITIRVHPAEKYDYETFEGGSRELIYSDKQYSFSNINNIAHLSIWKQKSRIRVYVNQEKIVDLPKAMKDTYNRIIFSPYYSYNNKEDMLYITNVRLAIGEANTRNKLITEGKFVTHGILFESGSDKISLQSSGVLKEIAAVLSENKDLKVKIVGHTDSDGNDAANLSLSEKRAEAVKNVLVTVFAIDADRMDTSGKGETQPVAANTTAEGKANNRRVEFIKE